MRKNEPMPTAIFSAKKIDYIVKPRNIYGPKLVKTKKDLRLINKNYIFPKQTQKLLTSLIKSDKLIKIIFLKEE